MTKDELVGPVARAIAIGCGLDPDAPSPKAAAAGHIIPEWHFFVPAARAALAIAMPAAFEMAAEVAEKRAEARFADFGTTEPDTNASYYSGRRGETLEELDEEDAEIAQTIRAEGEKWK